MGTLAHCAAGHVTTATAGRLLRSQQSGNVSALADDCWELGYSVAQGQLTRRADTNVLKPAGGTTRPPPSSANEPPPGLVSAATVEASLRSVIESQLRMDRELADSRRRAAAAETQGARLQRLEEQLYEMQRACAARDAKIDQLEDVLRRLLDRQTAADGSAAAQANRVRLPAASSTDNEPQPTEVLLAFAAKDIAAAIDLKTLVRAIADAIHW